MFRQSFGEASPTDSCLLSSQTLTLSLLFARKLSMKDSLMTYSESNVVGVCGKP